MAPPQTFSLKCYQNAAIVLLHPNLHGHRSLLVEALGTTDRTTFYASVPGPHTNAVGLLELLQGMLREQDSVSVPDLEKAETQSVWAKRLSQYLADLAPYCLILDSIDLADQHALLQLLLVLSERLPPDSQIVLIGRSIPCTLLRDPVLRKRITMVPVDESTMLIDYSKPSTDQILLEVHAFGPGRVLINGRSINDWDGALPRKLFFYLLDRRMATRDDIFLNFWSDISIRDATNVFHVTKRKVNEILGFDLMTYAGGYYQLAPNFELHYDVSKFIEAIQYSSVVPQAEAIEHLERAIALYRGEFMSSVKSPWARNRRLELRAMYAESLTMLSDLYAQQNRSDIAAALQQRSQLFTAQDP